MAPSNIPFTAFASLEYVIFFFLVTGILCWIVELGRVDIYCEVSMLSSCLALPRVGHLEQLFLILAHLRHFPISSLIVVLVFPPLYLPVTIRATSTLGIRTATKTIYESMKNISIIIYLSSSFREMMLLYYAALFRGRQ